MINLVGSWGGFTSNGSGVVKFNIDFNKENFRKATEIAEFTDEQLLTVTVTPTGEKDGLVFESVEYFGIKGNGGGDTKVTFRTLTQFLAGAEISFADLETLTDAQVDVSVVEMEE